MVALGRMLALEPIAACPVGPVNYVRKGGATPLPDIIPVGNACRSGVAPRLRCRGSEGRVTLSGHINRLGIMEAFLVASLSLPGKLTLCVASGGRPGMRSRPILAR